jgi:hypothetical protein
MRVTVDLDSQSIWRMVYYAMKGVILLKKLPEIRKTSKGWHLIFRSLHITEEESLNYRRRLGDDPNRILLDMLCKKKIKQVLFTEKETIYYGGLPAWWIKKGGEILKECPKCGKEIVRSEKRWKIDEKRIAVFHKDSVCYFELG